MERVPITIDSHVIHLRKFGSNNKTAVVLVHGIGVSGDYYIKFAEELAPFYDLHVIDLPGYGKTPKPARALTIQELANIVTAYVATNTTGKSAVIGQSMGCQIVAHAVHDSPKLFSKAIMLAPTINRKERTLPMQCLRLIQDTFYESLDVNIIVFTNYLRMGLKNFLITSKYMIEDKIEDIVKDISIPILYIGGSKDKIVPSAWVKYLAGITPKGSSIIMKSAPHLLQYQKPDELEKITRKFIDS